MDVTIRRTDSGYRLETETRISRPLDEVFPFFADCRNLERITPGDLRFQILNRGPIPMRTGQIIDYRLRLGGVSFLWKTEITDWNPPFRFVDTQLRGPYRRWVHEHTFVACGETTIMIDHVDFLAPGGRLVHELLVNRMVKQIFRHRAATFAEIFPARRTPDNILPGLVPLLESA